MRIFIKKPTQYWCFILIIKMITLMVSLKLSLILMFWFVWRVYWSSDFVRVRTFGAAVTKLSVPKSQNNSLCIKSICVIIQYRNKYFMHSAQAAYILSSYQFLRQQTNWIISCRHKTETKSIFFTMLSLRSLRAKINYIGRGRTHFEDLWPVQIRLLN
jgi:uncharacterized membrane protein YobD (UPF0266 family)